MNELVVPSFSDPTKSYLVEVEGVLPETGESVLRCECERFAFSRRGAKRCRHTRIFQAVEVAIRRCREVHGLVVCEYEATGARTHSDRLCASCLSGLLVMMAREMKTKIAAAAKKKRVAPIATSDGEPSSPKKPRRSRARAARS